VTDHTGAVVFGSVPFATPWLTEHNLAWALRQRMPVDWVDPPRSPLTPQRGALRRRGDGAASAHAALRVHQPQVLPPISNAAAQRLSRPLVRLQLRNVKGRSLGVFARGPAELVSVTRPGRSVLLIKDWTPAGAQLIGRSERALEHEVLSMCRAVDVVCAVTETLQATLRERGIGSHLLRHGFAADMAQSFDGVKTPSALARLRRPIVGYVGRVDDRLDWTAIRRIAERHRDGTVALIGPLSPRLPPASTAIVEGLANVTCLGPVDRAALPAHLVALDCCLLPYRPGVWGSHGSPLKLWEYLYSGVPIVGSGYEVLREYRQFVDYVPPEELPEAVERALASVDGGDIERRRRFALENTWDHRAAELLALAGHPARDPTGG
jgi:glycosyltransferase involved in cell wall biosynthesis